MTEPLPRTDLSEPARSSRGAPTWLLGLGPVVLIAVLIGLFSLLDAPDVTTPEGRVPEEVLAVESIRLQPGTITLEVRNEGADTVVVAQVNVSDFYAPFTQTRTEIGPLQRSSITVSYPWVEGDPYEVSLVTSTGGKIVTPIEAAVASNEQGASFFGLMALLGLYVGVIPIALGLLWMPFVRRSSPAWVRGLLAFTIGLLAYLAFDAALEGVELVADSGAFGGSLVVVIGALVAYLALEGVEGFVHRKGTAGGEGVLPPEMLALLISIGIGLHNLGEGLAIGAAYGAGSLALGAFLVIGFAIHNTTEGLAIVTPLARVQPSLGRLAMLGLIAGSPAILGALVGATVQQPTLVAFLFGVGAGAVGQVALKLLPVLRGSTGRVLTPLTSSGIIAGIAFMFLTGLLVAV